MNDFSLRSENRQSQALTPRLQHAVRLLQMSSLDYVRELHETAARNPFLDAEDDHATGHGADLENDHAADQGLNKAQEALSSQSWLGDDAGAPNEASTAAQSPANEAEHDGNWERDSWTQPGSSHHSSESSGSNTSAMDMMVAHVRLSEHLHGQANVLPLSDRDRLILYAVIESIDDDGYLRLALDDVANTVDLNPPAEPSELSMSLHLLQSFDPPGVGARDIAECLQLQLAHADIEEPALARVILGEHIDRLARRDLAGLARCLQCSVEAVSAACASIRRLDPRPGWRFGQPDVQYIAPDVVVRKVRGRWVAKLNSAVMPRVRLNRVYADMFKRHRDAGHGELAAHLQEARWTLRNVEQRYSTILSVAEAIVQRQALFLEHGSFAMKPLGLKEIADEVGVHESTVCRVTNNKYMATPGGVFELKHFFSRAMPTASGGACSGIAIRGVIREMIDSEVAQDPLSDVDIAQRLARQGLTVARRTVTKYRQMLKVPAVEQRRADRQI